MGIKIKLGNAGLDTGFNLRDLNFPKATLTFSDCPFSPMTNGKFAVRLDALSNDDLIATTWLNEDSAAKLAKSYKSLFPIVEETIKVKDSKGKMVDQGTGKFFVTCNEKQNVSCVKGVFKLID